MSSRPHVSPPKVARSRASRAAPWLALLAAAIPPVACNDDEAPLASASPTPGASTTAPGASSPAPTSTAPPKPVTPLALEKGCQPLLAGADCTLPYPSDFFRVADPSMPSGHRIETTGAAKLRTASGGSADVTEWLPIDGYSRLTPIVGLLGGPMIAEGLVGILDPPEPSTQPSSKTLIIDAKTGDLVPHFVDLDARATDPDRTAITLRPLVALAPQRRYVVVIRGVKGPSGALAPAPEGFRRLRDRDDDPSLAALRQRFDAEVFPLVEKVGVARADAQLAWDFTTGSDEHAAADLLAIREQTLAALAAAAPTVKITGDKKNTDPSRPLLWRTITGTVTVPLFVSSAQAGATLTRGPDGKVKQSGTAEVPFTINVPKSLENASAPGRALAYGHGFFGDRTEIDADSTLKIADSLGAVLFGIDWWGMSIPDRDVVIAALSGKPTEGALFTDRVHQAMANWAVMTAAIKGPLAKQEALLRDGDPTKPLYDPSNVYFLGISQGHILGGTLAAFDPNLARVCLNVGGAGLSHMMFRALPFSLFLLLLGGPLPSPLQQQTYAASIQRQLDRIDPGFWASRVLADQLPGSPPDRRVLMQVGIGDTQVPNHGSFLHARLLGLPQLTPTPRPVFGLTPAPSPHDGSAFSLYDLGFSDDFYAVAKAPAKETPVHNGVRTRADVIDQMDQFFRPDSKVVASDKGP